MGYRPRWRAAGRNAASLYRPHLAGKGREKLELESALHDGRLTREERALEVRGHDDANVDAPLVQPLL